MRTGITGAGNMGAALAAQLTRTGHHAAITSSRGPWTLTGVAAQTSAAPAPRLYHRPAPRRRPAGAGGRDPEQTASWRC